MSESGSSDEECVGLLKKAIDVELPANFNPNSVPQNGEEYLHHVNTKRVAPDYCLPTKEWQDNKIEDFTDFRKYVHSKITSEPTVTSFNEECFIEKVRNEIPVFSQVTQYSQASKIRMLQIIAKYLEALSPGESIEDNMGTWIYAILTLLEIPLSPSCCHTLREFAKKCAVLRSNLPNSVNESLYTPLNLYICLVARYFNQLDLAD
ncbi:hypothetical protein NQ314_019322 [Rhamnusium bicolor]|uniref:Gem-associated protein 2 n=1 Tax=Rhamnusium bicolor TaxID=1586634 RepID=A0AAV8WNG2_9CUCU|nr:hypothetical protein NQ314_019322 [Rhamnusium bicolor]